MTTIAQARQAFDVAERIKPMLAGLGPDVQGATLVELTATWLGGHPKEVRDQLWRVHFSAIKIMTEIHARHIRGEP